MSTTPHKTQKIIIVGAGLGGLSLAILLEKAGQDYVLLERATEVRNLGSAMSIGPIVGPMLQQMGIYEELTRVGKPGALNRTYSEDRKLMYVLDYSETVDMTSFRGFIIARPTLYAIMLKHVPASKILMNKKVTSIEQDPHQVKVSCEDGSSYEGTILVGADGAHSTVRETMYKDLKEKGILPMSDQEQLQYQSVCLVGQTLPLDPEEFPEVLDASCWFQFMIGDKKPYNWSTFTTRQDTICWSIIKHLDGKQSVQRNRDNTDWGPEAAEAMCNEVRHCAIAAGDGMSKVLGDLIDLTPKNLISKVMLEEKVFETWYHGRIVLLGDACHKMNPSGGEGAANAMHDALTIANWINILPGSATTKEVEEVFAEYKEERYPIALAAFETSQKYSVLFGKSFSAEVSRTIIKYLPSWIMSMGVRKLVSYRPQAAFLPPCEDTGKVRPLPQPSLEKTRKHYAVLACA